MNTPLPQDFLDSISELRGVDAARLAAALDGEPNVSVNLNAWKCDSAGLAAPAGARRVKWASNGFYLAERAQFTFDPLFHAGAYYVEEPSSMFVEKALAEAMKQTSVKHVLDLCAAPGGKSVLMRGMLDDALLVANEPVPKRAAVLAENVSKWGHEDVVVTSDFPKDFAHLAGFFDVVAADVPCSGEGMFRKDENARSEWSKANVALCAKRQREIVSDVWPALRSGGFLIYSTCTFNREEDEDNVDWIARNLGAEIVSIDTASGWGVFGDTTGRGMSVNHFFPHLAKGEGFFLALLRKTSAAETAAGVKHGAAAVFKRKSDCSQFINDAEDFVFGERYGNSFAIKEKWADDFVALASKLKVLTAGVPLTSGNGETGMAKPHAHKKPKPKPSAALALSRMLRRDAFCNVPLDYADAMKFLRGESLAASPGVERGWCLMTYKNLPLGFANNVGARLNNPYPQAWRIKSTHLPDAAPELLFEKENDGR